MHLAAEKSILELSSVEMTNVRVIYRDISHHCHTLEESCRLVTCLSHECQE